MSTSPMISNVSTTGETTQQPSKEPLESTTEQKEDEKGTSEVPIIHHHKEEVESTTQKALSTTSSEAASSSHHEILAPTTTMVTVVSDEKDDESDPLRSGYGHKSFYHLNALNDDILDDYCKHYSESSSGSKHAKLARLMLHFPNFNRKGMERFTLDALKEMCSELKLSMEGKKSILIDRLFNSFIAKHKGDNLEFTVDNNTQTLQETTESSPSITEVPVHHIHEGEDVEINKKTGEPLRKSPRVKKSSSPSMQPRVVKRKQTEKESSSKKQKAEDSITREYFMKHATDLEFLVDGKEHVASKKPETHKSFGWHYSGRSNVEIGSCNVPVTVTLNVTVNKSGRKDGSDEEGEDEE